MVNDIHYATTLLLITLKITHKTSKANGMKLKVLWEVATSSDCNSEFREFPAYLVRSESSDQYKSNLVFPNKVTIRILKSILN